MASNLFRIAGTSLFLSVALLAGCSSDDADDSGTPGAGGTGGSGGAPACTAAPAPTAKFACADIASLKQGDPNFTLTSPDFANCGEIPKATQTCDGKEFGTGSSPTLSWTGAPAGTLSFALIFKDIAILAENNPARERFAYHWVMWDIPATVTSLPAAMTGGYHSTEVPGALQWASRGNYAFFPPCPNPFPMTDMRFTCSLVIDSYSFQLFALPVAKLQNLPEPDLDAMTGMPTGNWAVKMGHFIETQAAALAVTEHRGTSSAWAGSFVPAATPAQFPCTQAMITGGMTTGCLQ
jgi:phosphatidylethanolamine-binding protein (PEBP) family uncharacterized protein